VVSWAGAFLGIVTEFKLRLHPIPAALPVVNAVYPASCAQQVQGVYCCHEPRHERSALQAIADYFSNINGSQQLRSQG
jgi:hypothetical protein